LLLYGILEGVSRLVAEFEEIHMRSFILACIAVVVIAMAGAAVLSVFQETAAEAFSTSAVRL
jgi:uncharacterized membrane protein affecting hemolysin expression